jgi:hypothetical protein
MSVTRWCAGWWSATLWHLGASSPRGGRIVTGSSPDATLSAAVVASPGPGAAPAPAPRVFISYARESDEHAEAVRDLWVFLRANGVDARLDRIAAQRRQDWPLWMEEQIDAADHVLVIASPAYGRRAGADAGPDDGAGVQYEARLLRNLFYQQQKDLSRFIPVVLPGGSPKDLPAFLTPAIATVYRLSELTVPGAEALLRLLLNRPAEVEPDLRQAPDLPARTTTLTAAPVPPVVALRHDVLDAPLPHSREEVGSDPGTFSGKHALVEPPDAGTIASRPAPADTPQQLPQPVVAPLTSSRLTWKRRLTTPRFILLLAVGATVLLMFELGIVPSSRPQATTPSPTPEPSIILTNQPPTPPPAATTPQTILPTTTPSQRPSAPAAQRPASVAAEARPTAAAGTWFGSLYGTQPATLTFAQVTADPGATLKYSQNTASKPRTCLISMHIDDTGSDSITLNAVKAEGWDGCEDLYQTLQVQFTAEGAVCRDMSYAKVAVLKKVSD